VLAGLALSGALTLAALDGLGALSAAALLVGELARDASWQQAGLQIATQLAEALLACTRLLALDTAGANGTTTTAAALRAVRSIRPLVGGEAGLALRHALRVAEGGLAGGLGNSYNA
jgi:hypothetical protein